MNAPPCDLDLLTAELTADEGRRSRRYRCPSGHWTIGIGHNLEARKLSPEIWAAIKADNPQLENALLDDQAKVSDAVIDALFAEDVMVAIAALDGIWIGWRALSEARKRALINLSFQMSQDKLLGFIRFWRALRQYQFDRAAAELKDSQWYRQTQPSRTERVIGQISGELR